MKRFTTLLLCLLMLCCCGLRVYTICVNTEAETGFLIREDWSALSTALLMVLGSVVMALAARKGSDEAPRGIFGAKAKAAATAVAMLGVLLDTVGQMLRTVTREDMLLYIWWIVSLVLGAASVLVLAAQAVAFAKAQRPKLYPALYLLPSLWFAARALLAYLGARIVITVPALVLEIVTLLLLCGVWGGYARVQGNVNAAHGKKLMEMMLPAALLCGVVCVLPAALASLFCGSAISPVGMPQLMLAAQLPMLWQLFAERVELPSATEPDPADPPPAD